MTTSINNKQIFWWLVSLLICLFSFNSYGEMTATQLVSKLDEFRGYQNQGFSFNITNVSYKQDKEPRKNQLSVRVLDDQSLVRFESPARDKGRAMLKEDKNMWLYIPGTRKVIRIAPSQRLIGETSNGDVVGANFSKDYDAKILKEDTVESQKYWVLELTANEKGVTYSRVLVWMSQADGNQPLKSEFYSRSNKILKTAYYKEFKTYNGDPKVHKILLVDALVKESYTWMKFDGYQLEKLDPATFQKGSLSKLNF